MMSEAAKHGYKNGFFDYVFGFFAWHLLVSSVYSIPRRGRGVWSGVGAGRGRMGVSAETKDTRSPMGVSTFRTP